jgi:hypothetical protein
MRNAYRVHAASPITTRATPTFTSPSSMRAPPNSPKVSGEARIVTTERAHTSSRNDTVTSCEARKNTFHRMAPPRSIAIASGTRTSARHRKKVKRPQIEMSSSGQ